MRTQYVLSNPCVGRFWSMLDLTPKRKVVAYHGRPSHRKGSASMLSNRYRASSHAGIASKRQRAQLHTRIDFVTRYCGLSSPMLFKRIGPMPADGQPAKTTLTCIASEPAQARLGNRIQMTDAEPSNRLVIHRPIGREPMGARAGPLS